MSRIERLCLALAVIAAIAASADVVSCAWTTEGIREGDWVLLVAALGFLGCGLLRPRLAQKPALGLLAAAFCWVTLEAALTFLTHSRGRPEAWYVWPPRYQCQVVPHDMPGVPESGVFSTNSMGIRGREFSTDDRCRVLCVGGSTTECFYLDDRKAWPAALEQELARDKTHVWVGNVGRSGLTTTDHLTVLTHLPEAQQVDCWIILCGLNDLAQQLNGDYDRGLRETLDRSFAYRRPGFAGRLDRPLYRNTYLFALLKNTARWIRLVWKFDRGRAIQDQRGAWYADARSQRQQATKVDRLPDLAPILDTYEQNLRRIVALSRERGKRLVFLTQPAAWSEHMPPELEQLCWGGWQPDGNYLTTGSLTHALAAFNERLRAVCAAERVEYVDLAAQLPATTETFYDDCHFNETGAAAVARILTPLLR